MSAGCAPGLSPPCVCLHQASWLVEGSASVGGAAPRLSSGGGGSSVLDAAARAGRAAIFGKAQSPSRGGGATALRSSTALRSAVHAEAATAPSLDRTAQPSMADTIASRTQGDAQSAAAAAAVPSAAAAAAVHAETQAVTRVQALQRGKNARRDTARLLKSAVH